MNANVAEVLGASLVSAIAACVLTAIVASFLEAHAVNETHRAWEIEVVARGHAEFDPTCKPPKFRWLPCDEAGGGE